MFFISLSFHILFCPIYLCLITTSALCSPSQPPPPPAVFSAGTRPAWRQIRSWTRTSVSGWVWAAVRPSPMAATVLTWQPPDAWPNVSSTWTASESPMWRGTSARSELLYDLIGLYHECLCKWLIDCF